MRKTQNYNLPQFDDTDVFSLEDYNSAFDNVDKALSDIQDTINLNENGLLIAQKVKLHDTQLAEKAQQIELEIERKRIDSFTSLAQGSTTGDAELIDARIGANGIVYSNLGSATREQINDINNNVIYKIGGDIYSNVDFNKVISSYSVGTTGVFISYSGWDRSDYIDCSQFKKILISNSTHQSSYNCFYTKNTSLGYDGYLANSGFTVNIGQTIINVPVGAKYFIISNNTDSMNNIKVKGVLENKGSFEERIINLENKQQLDTDTINIASYNVGLFNDGLTYVANDKVEEFAIKFRKFFGKQNVDILNGQEFMQYFNVGQNIESTSLITNFKYDNNTKSLGYGSIIFSKKALSNSVKVNFTQGSRSYIKSFINVNGKDICIINAHTSSEVDFNTNRKIQFQELITEMNKHSYVILTGDFNAFSKSEFDLFKTAGYKIANGGDFGWFDTWHNCGRPDNGWTNRAIDNIIVSSNISIQNIEMIEGQLSDHAPLIAELKII